MSEAVVRSPGRARDGSPWSQTPAGWARLVLLSVTAVTALLGAEPYRVFVEVLDPSGRPVPRTSVWASVPAIPAQTDDGWLFEIDPADAPPDGMVTLTASDEYAEGHAEAFLHKEANQEATIRLSWAAPRERDLGPSGESGEWLGRGGKRLLYTAYGEEDVWPGRRGGGIVVRDDDGNLLVSERGEWEFSDLNGDGTRELLISKHSGGTNVRVEVSLVYFLRESGVSDPLRLWSEWSTNGAGRESGLLDWGDRAADGFPLRLTIEAKRVTPQGLERRMRWNLRWNGQGYVVEPPPPDAGQ